MATEYTGTGDPIRSMELLWSTAEETVKRGPRPKLRMPDVVRKAVALADRDGLAALSMRRLADDLGVGDTWRSTPVGVYFGPRGDAGAVEGGALVAAHAGDEAEVVGVGQLGGAPRLPRALAAVRHGDGRGGRRAPHADHLAETAANPGPAVGRQTGKSENRGGRMRNGRVVALLLAFVLTRSPFGRAMRAVRDNDLVARLGGDEFAIIARNVAGAEGAAQIARRLYISESTAKTHVANIYEKLGAGNRAQAVMAAVRLGLVGDEKSGSRK